MISKLLKEIQSGKILWNMVFSKKHLDNIAGTVATRFILLFESHGVHRNQIPRFFDHGLMLVDVENDENLLPKLTEEILSDACEMFAIRREWLDGAEPMIYQCHDFYKHSEDFKEFIEQLIARNPKGNLGGVVIAPNKNTSDSQALLILEETIGFVGDKEIYRQYICYAWNYQYWKCRGYLASCMGIAWKRKVYIKGRFVPNEFINEYIDAEKLMGWNGEGLFAIKGQHWYPEDMTFSPEDYLKNIDEGLHGKIMALKLWVDLYDKGLMDSGLNYPDARRKFLAELDKLKKKIKN